MKNYLVVLLLALALQACTDSGDTASPGKEPGLAGKVWLDGQDARHPVSRRLLSHRGCAYDA